VSGPRLRIQYNVFWRRLFPHSRKLIQAQIIPRKKHLPTVPESFHRSLKQLDWKEVTKSGTPEEWVLPQTILDIPPEVIAAENLNVLNPQVNPLEQDLVREGETLVQNKLPETNFLDTANLKSIVQPGIVPLDPHYSVVPHPALRENFWLWARAPFREGPFILVENKELREGSLKRLNQIYYFNPFAMRIFMAYFLPLRKVNNRYRECRRLFLVEWLNPEHNEFLQMHEGTLYEGVLKLWLSWERTVKSLFEKGLWDGRDTVLAGDILGRVDLIKRLEDSDMREAKATELAVWQPLWAYANQRGKTKLRKLGRAKAWLELQEQEMVKGGRLEKVENLREWLAGGKALTAEEEEIVAGLMQEVEEEWVDDPRLESSPGEAETEESDVENAQGEQTQTGDARDEAKMEQAATKESHVEDAQAKTRGGQPKETKES
jgi:hypothetical protein